MKSSMLTVAMAAATIVIMAMAANASARAAEHRRRLVKEHVNCAPLK